MKTMQLDGCEYFEKTKPKLIVVECLDGLNHSSMEAMNKLIRRSASENICNQKRKLFAPVLKEIAERLEAVSRADRRRWCWATFCSPSSTRIKTTSR